MVGPWVIDGTNLYRDLRTGTEHIGNWASRDSNAFPMSSEGAPCNGSHAAKSSSPGTTLHVAVCAA